jgi:hypothetical protein
MVNGRARDRTFSQPNTRSADGSGRASESTITPIRSSLSASHRMATLHARMRVVRAGGN